jgi:hypothetical protein
MDKPGAHNTLLKHSAQHCLLTRTDGALLLCFLPPSLRPYAMMARQGRSRCCLSMRLGQNRPQTLRRASYPGKSACASMLRPTPARDYGGEHLCHVSLPCIGIL